MKKTPLAWGLLILLAGMWFVLPASAATTPVAAFVSNVTSGTAPLGVLFIDESTNSPTSWVWSFGDGNISTTESPAHMYTAAGTYTVTLTATNSAGSDTVTQTGYITVSSPGSTPVAAFIANVTSGPEPLPVQFVDSSTNSPTSWVWSFGDGGLSTLENPSHTYTSAGNYTVTLTATNAAGSSTISEPGYIVVGKVAVMPVASFVSSVTSGTAPLTIRFVDSSTNAPTSWAWSFGDGTASTLEDPSHTYTDAGTYTVTLTATNAAGSNTVTETGYITVSLAAPVASFTANITSGTAPLAVNFTDTSTNTPTEWYWSFGDGGTSTSQNVTYVYANPGTYTVSLTASNQEGGNETTASEYITVTAGTPPPAASFTADVTGGSAPLTVHFTDTSGNSPTSWVWSFGDGTASTLQNPSHTYAGAGTYTVTLTASNAGGSNTATRNGYITAYAAAMVTTLPATTLPAVTSPTETAAAVPSETPPQGGVPVVVWIIVLIAIAIAVVLFFFFRKQSRHGPRQPRGRGL